MDEGIAVPHFRIEYSGNLDAKINMAAFCQAIHIAIMETALFELGAVRVRAHKSDAFAIADQLPENAFIDMNFRVGEGRTREQLKQAGEHVFARAREHLSQLFATPHFALSFQIEEINGKLSWKDNAMHARLRAK